MDIAQFNKNYNAMIMSLIKDFHQSESASICRIVTTGSHYQLSDAKENIERLVKMKMLLDVYPGCDMCFEPDCTSDHK